MSTKCGCPDCKGREAPHTRQGWKALKNRHGDAYGICRKPGAKKGALKHKS